MLPLTDHALLGLGRWMLLLSGAFASLIAPMATSQTGKKASAAAFNGQFRAGCVQSML